MTKAEWTWFLVRRNKTAYFMIAPFMILFFIFTIIPVSMNISSIIEDTYNVSMETTIQEAEDITDEIGESTDSDGNIIEQALSKIKDGVTGLLEKGETLLNHFIETIAVMLVTACVIPILVLLFMICFVQMLFGIKVNVSKDMLKKNTK